MRVWKIGSGSEKEDKKFSVRETINPTEESLSTEEPDENVYQVVPDGESRLQPKIDDTPRQQEAA